MASDKTTKQPAEASTEGPAVGPAEVTPPYREAAIAGGLVFGLYALTLAPTSAFWDTSEYIATAHIMGIPHPPGNPLFVVFGRARGIRLTRRMPRRRAGFAELEGAGPRAGGSAAALS
jgi:hypothetical protein